MKAKDVIDRARIILQDADSDYWDSDELPKWLTDGRMAAYKLRPDLYEKTETVTLATGVSQTLPNSSKKLFEVIRNVSHKDGRQITLVDAVDLGRVRPGWRKEDGSAEVLHYMYTESRGGVYDVYPPASSGTTVEISYAKAPSEISQHDSSTELTEEGECAIALVDYILYRSFLKEADTVPSSFQRAAQHYNAFQAALTGIQPQEV